MAAVPRRIIVAIVFFAAVAFIVTSVALAVFRDKLFDFYMQRLDGWVEAGGDPQTVEAVVIESCGRLVMSQAGWFERVQLATTYRDEYAFRLDVCTKMTVNRLYKQPELEEPELVRMICGDTHPYHELLVRLCKHDGLRP